MNLKKEILRTLSARVGEPVSSKELCGGRLSRNAVWKAVCALQDEGYAIESVGRRGYKICEAADFPCSDEIGRLLGDGYRVEVIEETASTNSDLRQRAENGEKEGLVLIACRQKGGRGRMGRSFYSSEGGLYMSLLLRPMLSAQKGGLVTGTAAVAVARAIEKNAGIKARIKWVNDVFCRGKKVCGILSEAAVNLESGSTDYIVLGIGLNVYEPKEGFPRELEAIAGSLFAYNEKRCGLIDRIAADIVLEFTRLLESSDTKEEYKSRCFLLGECVTAHRGNETFKIKVLDIDESYSLVAQTENGEITSVNSGEISVRPEAVPYD